MPCSGYLAFQPWMAARARCSLEFGCTPYLQLDGRRRRAGETESDGSGATAPVTGTPTRGGRTPPGRRTRPGGSHALSDCHILCITN
eukprot:1289535-Prymnesium_polylepis.1